MSAEASAEAEDEYNTAAARGFWPAFCDRSLAFSADSLAALHDIWRKLAPTDGIPNRDQFTPHILKPYLRNVAIYERVGDAGADRRYRVRLVGSAMSEVIGNLTGKFLDEAVPKQFLPRWYASLDATLKAARPLRFVSRSDTVHMEFLVGEYFSAPLRAPDGTISMILGGSHYDGSRPWSVVEHEARRNSMVGVSKVNFACGTSL